MGDQVVEEPERISTDEAVLQAMEIFAGMSPEEMEDTIMELIQMLGDGDPETKAELEVLLNELIPQIKSESNLNQMVQDDELAVATNDALRMLKGSNWDEIWAKQDVILEGVLASGHLTAEDAARFRTDEDAWKEELQFIWGQLQKQAAEAEL